MQKKPFVLVKKFKNTESARLAKLAIASEDQAGLLIGLGSRLFSDLVQLCHLLVESCSILFLCHFSELALLNYSNPKKNTSLPSWANA